MTQANTVAAIVIDPNRRTITQIRLPVHPPDEGDREWCTNQIRLEDIYAVLDCRHIGALPMPGCEIDSCFYNDEPLDADGKQVGFFQLGRDWDPVPGKFLVVGFDMPKHEYRDVTTTIDQIEAAVIWTRRIVRAYQVTTIEHGIRVDRVAPIVDEN